MWHLITCEYPPRLGGVADFTRIIAGALAGRNQTVHVWSPAPAEASDDRVVVHPQPEGYRQSRLADLDRQLDEVPGLKRLFLQWVPHGYGYKSLNVPFCFWVRRRVRQGDRLDLMIHEPFLPFDRSRIRQNVGAAVHRVMLRLLLGAADRVWVSTPSFLDAVRPFGPNRPIVYTWLPVPSPLAEVHDPDAVAALRARLAGGAPLVGYFGAVNPLVSAALGDALDDLVTRRPDVRIAFAGVGTDAFAATLRGTHPAVDAAVATSGPGSERELSRLLQACDVFVQPYADGASSRRTTLMALLSHGRPVVTNRGERTETFWAESRAIQLVEGGAATLGRAVEALLADGAAREALGARARSLYRSQFDVSRTLATLLDESADTAP